MDEPLARADLDDQAAAQERAEAFTDFRIAANLDTTAENLRQMGFGDAGNVLAGTADVAVTMGQTDVAQGQLLAGAANSWRTVAHDLDEQTRATGESYVAGATRQEAADTAPHAASDAEKTRLEALAAAAGAAQTALQHRAAELGHDAQVAAQDATADEAMARGLDR
jgi:hypothetical protein